MKEMCLPCYGTGQIRCLRCGGTGVESNSSLFGNDCLKCKGTRQGRCLLCRGSGFIGGDVLQEQIQESQVQWSLPVAA
jgi:hypothetical protein